MEPEKQIAVAYLPAIAYTPAGTLSSLSFNNGVTETHGWNDRIQEISVNATNVVGASLLGLNFFPCAGGATSCTANNGNILRQTISTGGQLRAAQEYRYDSLNRLYLAAEKPLAGFEPTCPDATSAWVQQFSYDTWGNRALPCRSDGGGTAWDVTSFSPINNRIQDARWQYDQAGNVIQNWSYETILYDAENRQVAFCRQDPGGCVNQPGPGRTLYAYDGLGRRVKRTDPNGAVTLFLYDAFGRLAAEYSTSSTAAGTRYFTGDHLGSTRLVTGMQTERHDYLPFGTEYTPAVGNWRLNTDVVTGYGVDTVRQKFTGQERDSETSLDFFHARYFSAPQGRFTSPDPGNAGANLYDPQSWNGYAYVSNNPLNYTDPDGLGIFGDLGSIIGTIFPGVGTLLGWGIGSIADLATGQSISPPGVIGAGTDIFRSIAAGVNNGQPWNEQLPIGGGGSLNTGTVFGSGNTGPFVFSFEDGGAWYQHAWVQNTADFVAGLGDSLSFTLSARFRKYKLGGRDTRNHCSGYYTAGEVTALATGLMRLGYAGAAKALPAVVGRGQVTEGAAQAVSSARNTLKAAARLGAFPNYRMYTWEQITAKYGTDYAKIISKSTQTSPVFNTGGGIMAGGAAVNLSRGCYE